MTAPPFEPRRFGAYTLEARLGHGGMAEVFRATREGVAGFAHTCVVKRILSHHNEDPSFVDMFINEAKIASKLTHPNIVQVYELGQVDGEFFIAMEYVKGRDLLRVLRELAQSRANDPTIPPALSAYIARETARALQHAHDHTDERGQARPIIHRDVSPQNIMLSYDGVVKLVDFGIAKALGSMRDETRTGALKGKFAYMAPEQVAGQNPGPTADVFSTGVVLHEMLTGRRLFKGASDFDTLQKVRTMEVPLPSSINPTVPPELDQIVMRSLERDRGARYARSAHLVRDLDTFLATVRFSVEEMAEFMRNLFPAELQDAPAAEHVTKEYPLKSTTSRSKSMQIVEETPPTGSGMPRGSYAAGGQRDHTPSGGTGGRRAVLVAVGLALLVGTGAIFMVGRRGAPEPAEPKTSAANDPAAPKAPRPVETPEVVLLPQEVRVVRVSSEPPGARVFEGPRLVGTAPVDLKLPVDSPGVPLTLVREGRMDLAYTVRPADAPGVTLRLDPATGIAPPIAPLRGSRPTGRPQPKPARPALMKPKVEIFDDATPAARPKVDAIDD